MGVRETVAADAANGGQKNPRRSGEHDKESESFIEARQI
jgi:hypothetical protein